MPDREKVEFIESYIKVQGGDYQWSDNHGELIRCKDCKFLYFASNRVPTERAYSCSRHGFDVTQDWFCADGKPKSKQLAYADKDTAYYADAPVMMPAT